MEYLKEIHKLGRRKDVASGGPLSEESPHLRLARNKPHLAPQEIRVDLVVARPLTGGEEEKLKEAIGKGFGHTFRLVFNYMDEIPRAANGKYEDFRSEV